MKDAVKGLVPEEAWTSWWTAARKNPQVVVHGSGKSATVEWSHSAGAADASLLAKFEKVPAQGASRPLPAEPEALARARGLDGEVARRRGVRLEDADPALAFEIAILVEKVPGVDLALDVERHVLERPLALLPRLIDRSTRERALELLVRERPAEAPAVLADWFFKEEDGRTIDVIDGRLAEIDAETRERTLDKLLKNPRSGPRAFVWFAQQAPRRTTRSAPA